MSKLIQAVSWQTEMGARGRLDVVCLLERLQGKACQWSVATYAWLSFTLKS